MSDTPTVPLSEMSDEQLSLLIAEYLEPLPTWDKQKMAFQWSSYVSDGGCWLRPSMSAGIQPRPMVHDPEMTVMLMERGKLSITPLDEKTWMVGRVWMNVTVTLYANEAKGENLKRCVAEAFASTLEKK